jgi:hypothetical protein
MLVGTQIHTFFLNVGMKKWKGEAMYKNARGCRQNQ